MSLAGFLRRVVEVLEDAGIPYMLTGSLASAYYATPRATQDIDLVIDAGAETLDRAVTGSRLDLPYVERWVAALDLSREWEHARQRVSEDVG